MVKIMLKLFIDFNYLLNSNLNFFNILCLNNIYSFQFFSICKIYTFYLKNTLFSSYFNIIINITY